jgi:hypothetical protein
LPLAAGRGGELHSIIYDELAKKSTFPFPRQDEVALNVYRKLTG